MIINTVIKFKKNIVGINLYKKIAYNFGRVFCIKL